MQISSKRVGTLMDAAKELNLESETLNILQDLVVRGEITIPNKYPLDLIDFGLTQLTKIDADYVYYQPVEPLMAFAIYKYLFSINKLDFGKLLLTWMHLIQNEELPNKYKGYTAEVLMAVLLLQVSDQLAGRPLTSHPLFSDYKGTFLDHYTLEAKEFTREKGALWKNFLMNKQTHLLLLPSSWMRPDIYGLLKCIPGNSSHARFGDHVIPLTVGCKLHDLLNPQKGSKLRKMYTDNYESTNPWEVFQKGEKLIDQKSSELAKSLLKTNFPAGQRCLRLSFLYKFHPIQMPKNDDQIYIAFHQHHDQFINFVKGFDKGFISILDSFIKVF